jgi:outer membrane immunogenic protein
LESLGAAVKLRTLLFSSTAISALCVAPAVAQPVFSWTGFYVGGNLGGVWAQSSRFDENNWLLAAGSTADLNRSGVIGGFQAGYNWQTSNLVFGLEGDLAFASASKSAPVIPGPPDTYSAQLSALGTIRGRVGLAFDRSLLYVTGGVAFASLKNELVSSSFGFTASRNTTPTGWTIGGGAEYAFGVNWTAKVEYLYAQFPTDTVTVAGFGYRFRFNDSVSVVRAGINYRF